MSSDVPLSDKGKERAEAMKEMLKYKKISYIFSTNTVRANLFCQRKKLLGDLPESAYSKLFIVTVKGKKASFKEERIPAYN